MKNLANFLFISAISLILPPGVAQTLIAGEAKGPLQGQAPGAVTAPPAVTVQSEVKRNRTTASVGPDGTYYRASSSAESIPPLVIQFSSTNQSMIQEWEEDLTVMTRLLEEALQRAADEDLTDVPIKLAIPITTLVTGNRSVRPLYLEGFGVVFMVKVNFPVVPPTKVEDEKEKPERSESDWEKVRRELYGRRQQSWMGGNVESGADYDSDQVDTLKKELIESLKNAANFRHLKPDEYVSITVFGSPNSGVKVKLSKPRKKGDAGEALAKEIDRTVRDQFTRGRVSRPGTVLTLRVKKSDIDAFSKGAINYDAFEHKIATNTYLGNGYGVTSLNSWIQSTLRQLPLNGR